MEKILLSNRRGPKQLITHRLRCFDNMARLIRKKRTGHQKAYSQRELSTLLGYKNGQFISNVERELCNIPFKMLKKTIDILDISKDELISSMLEDYERTIKNHLETFDK